MFLQRRYKNGQQAHEKMFHLLTIREMQMKNKMKYHHIPNKMETIKSTEIKRVSEDMEKLEHLGTVDRNEKKCSHHKNSTVVIRKLKSRISIWPKNSISGYITKELNTETWTDFCISIAAKNLPAMQETLVWFLGWEDPLEKR